ncbi:hypothetical protein KSP35_10275 [Aquihabitans sp. G128]|uniref:hypothetical protein n=1 Tax=Aquihabitans sp. G128 TaxID=2849779 RepID=UPI001C2429BC|nr:hypothetical protein [Aquihabitans sp. G128]QXC63127.1 hypothetical protein KSP35_10275 [Aquihabitans sp. G128]
MTLATAGTPAMLARTMGPTTTLTAAAAAASLVAVVLVAVRARRPLRGGLGLVDVVAPGAAAGAVVAIGLVVVLVGGVDSRAFTAVHAAYLGLVVSVPALGAALGLRRLLAWRAGVVAVVGARLAPRWRAASDVLAVLLLVVPAPVGWYATHVVPYDLRVDRASVVLPTARAAVIPSGSGSWPTCRRRTSAPPSGAPSRPSWPSART